MEKYNKCYLVMKRKLLIYIEIDYFLIVVILVCGYILYLLQ